MSSEAEVTIVDDTLSKKQWGRNLFFIDYFYKNSGKKREIDKKRLLFAFLIGCSVLVIYQLILDPNDLNISRTGSISTPLDSLSTQVMEVPLVQPEDLDAKPPRPSQIATVKFLGPQVIARPKDLRAIPPGTFLSAILQTGASNGLVKAQSLEALKVNGETFIEKGATFVGSGSSGDERLNVAFSQVVFKDGSFGQVNAVACDASDKIVGLKGSKVGHKALNIIGSLGLGFLGGFSEGLQDTKGQQGVAVREPSMKNALLNGTATAALEQSKNLMGEVKNQPNIIEISQATPICILFGETR